jgi:hypothetical protein
MELASARIPDPLPTTLEECKVEAKRLTKELRDLERVADRLRKTEQTAIMELNLQQGDTAGAKGIKNKLAAEDFKEMWRQLRALNPLPDSGLTTVEIPTDGNLETNHCKNCTSWSLLTDPVEIRHAITCRNRLHFGQAHGTFPTINPFADEIDWAASTPASDQILAGTQPFDKDDLDETNMLFLHQLRVSTVLNSIKSEVTEAEWLGKMKSWKETTSTSPSGMHLGHYKALLGEFSDAVNFLMGTKLSKRRGNC